MKKIDLLCGHGCSAQDLLVLFNVYLSLIAKALYLSYILILCIHDFGFSQITNQMQLKTYFRPLGLQKRVKLETQQINTYL